MAADIDSASAKRICGHCKKEFSKTLYFQHRKKNEWKRKRAMEDVEEFTFSSDGEFLAVVLNY